MENLIEFLKVFGSLIILPIVYWIGRLEKQHNDFRLYVAENYVNKKDHKDDLENIKQYFKEGFQTILKRLEELREELDKKEDKRK